MAKLLRRCEECGRPGRDEMKGWRAFIGVDPDTQDPEPSVHVFCPKCAEREFGTP